MGRKIPAKKHRGVKDPLVQQARRLQSLKGKINAPPRDPDEQPVPKSLTRLFAPLTRAPRRARPGGPPPAPPTPAAAAGAVSRLRRLPGEGARSFSRRITGAVRALHADDAQHYPQEDEEEEESQRRRRRRAPAPERPERPTRAQRRKLRQRESKLAARRGAVEDARGELVYERVAFGDTAAAPPALPLPRLPRTAAAAATATTASSRPGRRKLLLTPLLKGAGSAAGSAAGSVGRSAADSAAERRRLAVVAAYRAHKAAAAARTDHARR